MSKVKFREQMQFGGVCIHFDHVASHLFFCSLWCLYLVYFVKQTVDGSNCPLVMLSRIEIWFDFHSERKHCWALGTHTRLDTVAKAIEKVQINMFVCTPLRGWIYRISERWFYRLPKSVITGNQSCKTDSVGVRYLATSFVLDCRVTTRGKSKPSNPPHPVDPPVLPAWLAVRKQCAKCVIRKTARTQTLIIHEYVTECQVKFNWPELRTGLTIRGIPT